IAIDIGKRTAGLDVQRACFDDVSAPALRTPAIPDHGGRGSAFRDYEIIDAVAIDIEDRGGRLLLSGIRTGEFSGGRGDMLPLNGAFRLSRRVGRQCHPSDGSQKMNGLAHEIMISGSAKMRI